MLLLGFVYWLSDLYIYWILSVLTGFGWGCQDVLLTMLSWKRSNFFVHSQEDFCLFLPQNCLCSYFKSRMKEREESGTLSLLITFQGMLSTPHYTASTLPQLLSAALSYWAIIPRQFLENNFFIAMTSLAFREGLWATVTFQLKNTHLALLSGQCWCHRDNLEYIFFIL